METGCRIRDDIAANEQTKREEGDDRTNGSGARRNVDLFRLPSPR